MQAAHADILQLLLPLQQQHLHALSSWRAFLMAAEQIHKAHCRAECRADCEAAQAAANGALWQGK
jgi:hypothetical protein